MKKILPILLIFSFVLSISMTIVLSSAEEHEEESTEGSEEVNQQDFMCAVLVQDLGMQRIEDYQQFLNEFFLIDEESSGQVLTAMEYFQIIRDEIDGVFEANRVQPGVLSFETAFEEFNYCQNVRNTYVDLAEVLLRSYTLQSANSKRTFAIIDGMKGLNSNMDELSQDFHLTFPRMFEKMNNALPCYSRECITR